MIKLKPLYDKIIILPDEQEKVTDGGIIIPDTAQKEKVETGTVLATGPGYYEHGKFIPITVRPGTKVLFGRYAGSETEIDEKRILVMRERDIIAILEDEE